MPTERDTQLALPFRIPVLRVFLLPFVQDGKRDRLFLILLACVMSTAGFLMQGNGSYDSDGWFLLATGKQIVENGIPYANPWSLSSYRPIGRPAVAARRAALRFVCPGRDTPARYSIRLSLRPSVALLHRLCNPRIRR